MNAKDSQTLEALRKAGSRLDLLHPIRHYIYVASHESAELLGGRLRLKGFQVEARPGALGDGQWLVLASHQAVPTAAEVERLRALFEKAALEVHGEYDGWEAGVTRV